MDFGDFAKSQPGLADCETHLKQISNCLIAGMLSDTVIAAGWLGCPVFVGPFSKGPKVGSCADGKTASLHEPEISRWWAV